MVGMDFYRVEQLLRNCAETSHILGKKFTQDDSFLSIGIIRRMIRDRSLGTRKAHENSRQNEACRYGLFHVHIIFTLLLLSITTMEGDRGQQYVSIPDNIIAVISIKTVT